RRTTRSWAEPPSGSTACPPQGDSTAGAWSRAPLRHEKTPENETASVRTLVIDWFFSYDRLKSVYSLFASFIWLHKAGFRRSLAKRRSLARGLRTLRRRWPSPPWGAPLG